LRAGFIVSPITLYRSDEKINTVMNKRKILEQYLQNDIVAIVYHKVPVVLMVGYTTMVV